MSTETEAAPRAKRWSSFHLSVFSSAAFHAAILLVASIAALRFVHAPR